MLSFHKTVTAVALVAAATVLLAACSSGSSTSSSGSTPSDSGPVTYAGYGGAAGDAITKEWLDPFTTSTGIKATLDPTMGNSKLIQMVQSGNVTWDIAEAGLDYDLTDANKTLVNIDCKVVECGDFTGGFKVTAKGVPLFVYSTNLAYNTNEIKTAPTNWSAFFDPTKYPGKRILDNSESFYGILEAALLSDGVKRDNLYPLDVNRALKVLDKIKPDIIYSSDPQACVDGVSSGEAVMGACYNGRITLEKKAGKPIDQVWNQQIQSADYVVIPKGSKHVSAAMKLIAYMTSKAHAGALSNAITYSPGNPEATINPKVKPELPLSNNGTGANAPIVPDWKWWNTNRAQVAQEVSQWVAQ